MNQKINLKAKLNGHSGSDTIVYDLSKDTINLLTNNNTRNCSVHENNVGNE